MKEIKTLDKGFIRLVDSMGNDSAIAQSARVSYGAGTRTVREDSALIDYLIKNKHLSPLEMVEFKFHIKLPIFIARQWMRHRTGSFNEISARYSVMTDDFYIPSKIRTQSSKNKQCSGDELDFDIQTEAREEIRIASKRAYESYKHLLDIGVSRETARSVLPVNIYTEFYWKVDLRNLLNFLSLRQDAHAQFEIREYANAICEIVKEIVPNAYKSFKKYNEQTN